MAEGIAHQWLQQHEIRGWQALSAGTWASNGCSISQGAVEALQKLGIEFDGTSKVVTKKMVEGADFVICMTKSHQSAVSSLVDDSSHVGVLDPNSPIYDPIGQEQSVYDSTAAQLESLIVARLEALIQQKA